MFFRYNFPGVIWGLIILILSGLPPDNFPDTSFLDIPHKDKIIHFGLFLVLVFLLSRGFLLQKRFIILKKSYPASALISGIAYGGITEILQEIVFITRGCEISDFISDVAGCCTGLALFLIFRKNLYPRTTNNFSD